MQIELSEQEIKLLIGALKFLDPTGFFTNKLIEKLLANIDKPI